MSSKFNNFNEIKKCFIIVEIVHIYDEHYGIKNYSDKMLNFFVYITRLRIGRFEM